MVDINCNFNDVSTLSLLIICEIFDEFEQFFEDLLSKTNNEKRKNNCKTSMN